MEVVFVFVMLLSIALFVKSSPSVAFRCRFVRAWRDCWGSCVTFFLFSTEHSDSSIPSGWSDSRVSFCFNLTSILSGALLTGNPMFENQLFVDKNHDLLAAGSTSFFNSMDVSFANVIWSSSQCLEK